LFRRRPFGEDSRMATRSQRSCAGCRARAAGLFCGLTGAAGQRLREQRIVHVFRRGQTIFLEGMVPTALHVIAAGLVKIFASWRGGEEHVLRLLGPGEILGYRPLLANEPYHASAEAVEDSTVCILPASAVREALHASPRLAVELLSKIARELRHSEELMLDLLHRRVPQRVARLLLAMPGWSGDAPVASTVWSSGITRKTMATIVGTTPETFSRALRELSRRGVISLSRNHIQILDLNALRRAAGLDPDQLDS
jgi:CRP-like cAMP-binding protein